MIRYSVLTLVLTGILAYAWKDWFRALCLLIMLVGVLERPDMPKSMLGVQGLNPFNICLAGILVAWVASRNQQEFKKPQWDAPRWFNLMLCLLVSCMFFAFVRLLAEPSSLVGTGAGLNPTRYTTFGLVSEFCLNTFKWMVPGILLFLGCRSKRDHQWAVVCLMGLYLILAVFTIRQMPLPLLLDGAALERRAAFVLDRRVGYHRVELAGVFAGASWAMLAARPLFSAHSMRLALVAMSGITVLALALTGGRTGYGAWCVLGALLASLRWRRALFVGPIVVALLIGYAPGVSERLLQGFNSGGGGNSSTRGGQTDLYTVTAGRSVLWPYVLESIAEQPIFGYGREAMNRNGLREKVFRATGEDFGHPHNGYLQFALDNGVIGLVVLLTFFAALMLKSVVLFRRNDPQATAAGGMAIALVVTHLIAAVGAQPFYPTEMSLGVWCAIGLLMRVWVQESHKQNAPDAVTDMWGAQLARRRRVWPAKRLQTELSHERGRSVPVKPRDVPVAHRSFGTGRLRVSKWKARRIS